MLQARAAHTASHHHPHRRRDTRFPTPPRPNGLVGQQNHGRNGSAAARPANKNPANQPLGLLVPGRHGHTQNASNLTQSREPRTCRHLSPQRPCGANKTGPAQEELGPRAQKPDQAKLGSGTRRGSRGPPLSLIVPFGWRRQSVEYWVAEHQRNPTPNFPKQQSSSVQATRRTTRPRQRERETEARSPLSQAQSIALRRKSTASKPFEWACRIRKDGQMAQPHAGKGISRRSELHSVMVACGWGLSGRGGGGQWESGGW